MKIRRRRKQTKEVGKSHVDFGKTQERFDHVAKDTEEMEFEKSLKEHEAQYAAAKPIQDLEKLTQEEIDAVVEGDRLCRVYERREATRKFIKNVISITDARSELSQVGIKLLELLDRIEGGDTSIHREFDTTSVKFVQLYRAECKKPTETGRNATPAKRWKIVTKKITGWIFKKTSHFICALIVAVVAAIIAAVVVDILADFGWLERINTFFTE